MIWRRFALSAPAAACPSNASESMLANALSTADRRPLTEPFGSIFVALRRRLGYVNQK
jgi:hypothetical protein